MKCTCKSYEFIGTVAMGCLVHDETMQLTRAAVMTQERVVSEIAAWLRGMPGGGAARLDAIAVLIEQRWGSEPNSPAGEDD